MVAREKLRQIIYSDENDQVQPFLPRFVKGRNRDGQESKRVSFRISGKTLQFFNSLKTITVRNKRHVFKIVILMFGTMGIRVPSLVHNQMQN